MALFEGRVTELSFEIDVAHPVISRYSRLIGGTEPIHGRVRLRPSLNSSSAVAADFTESCRETRKRELAAMTERVQQVTRFGWKTVVVLVLMMLTFASVGYVAARSGVRSAEWRWMAATYGADKFSQYEEEWVIRDFFGRKRDGIFVDVGAAHFRTFSNTYYLEQQLGWAGIAIDPQREFEAEYLQHRPRTKFLPFFVSDVSDHSVTLYVPGDHKWVASSDPQFAARWGSGSQEVEAPTVTLSDLLDREKVSRIDFLTVDVELAEPKVLAGFDIDRFQPTFVCIEAHPEVRQAILDYFAQHRYVLVGKYLRIDQKNLYFSPLGTPIPRLPPEVARQWTEQ